MKFNLKIRVFKRKLIKKRSTSKKISWKMRILIFITKKMMLMMMMMSMKKWKKFTNSIKRIRHEQIYTIFMHRYFKECICVYLCVFVLVYVCVWMWYVFQMNRLNIKISIKEEVEEKKYDKTWWRWRFSLSL